MFLGVDHGTTAIRFASEKGSIYELSRSSAADLSYEQILSRIEESLGPERVDLVALSYSMGDGLTSIVRLEDAANRGLISQDGAGLHREGGPGSSRPSGPQAGQPYFCPEFIARAE